VTAKQITDEDRLALRTSGGATIPIVGKGRVQPRRVHHRRSGARSRSLEARAWPGILIIEDNPRT
jgi:hypothetical protein